MQTRQRAFFVDGVKDAFFIRQGKLAVHGRRNDRSNRIPQADNIRPRINLDAREGNFDLGNAFHQGGQPLGRIIKRHHHNAVADQVVGFRHGPLHPAHHRHHLVGLFVQHAHGLNAVAHAPPAARVQQRHFADVVARRQQGFQPFRQPVLREFDLQAKIG